MGISEKFPHNFQQKCQRLNANKIIKLSLLLGTITENKEKIINNRAGKLVEERLRKEIEEAEQRLKNLV